MADELVNVGRVCVLCQGGIFVLYFRSQVELAHTCGGTINLAHAFIDVIDSCNFVISNVTTHVFYLRASSKDEAERWVAALELAKARIIRLSLLESGVIICWVCHCDGIIAIKVVMYHL